MDLGPFQAVFEWLQHHWPWAVGGGTTVGTSVFSFEKWRGQRLANRKLTLEHSKLSLETEKLALELKAMTLALRKEELKRVALEITGKELPETDDAPAAFRALLEDWAKGRAMVELHAELEDIKARLDESEHELSEFKCGICGAPLIERQSFPLDEEESDWGMRESYECGYQGSDYGTERLCPSDPKFPKLEEYELQTKQRDERRWSCLAEPKTSNARRLDLRDGYGPTEAAAIQSVKDAYGRAAKTWTRR